MGSGLYGDVEYFECMISCLRENSNEADPIEASERRATYHPGSPATVDAHARHSSSLGSLNRRHTSPEKGEVGSTIVEQIKPPPDVGGIVCDEVGEGAAFQEPIRDISVLLAQGWQGDLIVLATDGLTDNINEKDFADVVPMIVMSSVFDDIEVSKLDIWRETRLPSKEDMAEIITLGEDDRIVDIDCQVACRRLGKYTEWVTQFAVDKEKEYFALESRHVALTKEIFEYPEVERKAQQEVRKSELDSLKESLDVLVSERNSNRQDSKTDDAMLIVMRAYNNRAIHEDEAFRQHTMARNRFGPGTLGPDGEPRGRLSSMSV